MEKKISTKAFKLAAEHGGIPLDFREDDSEIVIVMVDGRKLTFEKELGTRKRIQHAEADQAEAAFAQAKLDYAKAKEAAELALTTMQHLESKAKQLREIADGKELPTAQTPFDTLDEAVEAEGGVTSRRARKSK